MLKNMLLLVCGLFLGKLSAQSDMAETADSALARHPRTLLEAFELGHFHGHFRSFFMATDNTRQLTDYHALAAGGGLHYTSASFHGLSFGIGGVFHYNLASSDLSKKDSTTGASNRYEIGLFDIENPKNRNNLDRLEALWIRWEHRNFRLTVGQQGIRTPLINPQDGRMRPTAVAGTRVEHSFSKKQKIEGGWLWRISPRSTVGWYDIGESIGLYPKGLNEDGSPSGYPQNVDSRGIGLFGWQANWTKGLRTQVWEQLVENVFNTVLVQADWERPLKKKEGRTLIAGAQLIRQNALADGGNQAAEKSYFQKGGTSFSASMQLGWRRKNLGLLAAATRITGEGRFLSPREWGREPFYTFMPRERVEGSGNVRAATIRAEWKSKSRKTEIGVAYGHFCLPEVLDFEMNKYGFPAFRQLNFDARHDFGGQLKGLRMQFLWVWKGRIGETRGNDRYVINRVDMRQFNLVLNYAY